MQKRHKPEEIVAKVRQVYVLVAQGKPVTDAIRFSWAGAGPTAASIIAATITGHVQRIATKARPLPARRDLSET